MQIIPILLFSYELAIVAQIPTCIWVKGQKISFSNAGAFEIFFSKQCTQTNISSCNFQPLCWTLHFDFLLGSKSFFVLFKSTSQCTWNNFDAKEDWSMTSKSKLGTQAS